MDNILTFMCNPVGNLMMAASLAVYYSYMLPSMSVAIPLLDLEWVYPVLIFALAYTPRRYFQMSLLGSFMILGLAKEQHEKRSRHNMMNLI